MKRNDWTISLDETAEPESVRRVEEIINDYNSTVMRSDYRPLTLLLRNGEGEVIGGLLGKTEWGWLYVATLAVRAEYRGRGCGSNLLARAEEEALSRGCHDAYLDTFSFQACPFYEKRGYVLFGVLENFTRHTKYFLRKRLR